MGRDFWLQRAEVVGLRQGDAQVLLARVGPTATATTTTEFHEPAGGRTPSLERRVAAVGNQPDVP